MYFFRIVKKEQLGLNEKSYPEQDKERQRIKKNKKRKIIRQEEESREQIEEDIEDYDIMKIKL